MNLKECTLRNFFQELGVIFTVALLGTYVVLSLFTWYILYITW